jgi:hypothetical protein
VFDGEQHIRRIVWSYAAEKRAALELWANHLAVVVAQAAGANVTMLKA